MSKSASLRRKNIIYNIFFYLLLMVFCLAAYILVRCIFAQKYTAVFLENVPASVTSSSTPSVSTTSPASSTSLIEEIIAATCPPEQPTSESINIPEIIYHPDSSLSSSTQINSVSNSSPAVSDPSLFFGSFFNSFVAGDSIDYTKTSLYRDKTAVAVFFPPDYSWTNADTNTINQSKNDFNKFYFNNSDGPYADERCFNINCLRSQDNNLFYNNKLISLPSSIKKENIVAVSIGALSSHWLVGITLKNGSKYEGQIFYFSDGKFTPLIISDAAQNIISSRYQGLFGFGGDDNDFLIVYGAYEGIAYHVQGNSVLDISKFFPIRVMDGGFKPEIIRTVNNREVGWYVFSETLNRPWFLKLWQNGTSDIVGEAVLKDFINLNTESAAFKLIKTTPAEISLLARTRENGVDYWHVFTDRGFKNEKPGVLVFTPISNNASSSPITIKKIASSELGLDAASLSVAKLLFSSNNNNWQEIPLGKNLDFSSPTIKNFFLKVTFASFKNKFYSPFLTSVSFDYYCQR